MTDDQPTSAAPDACQAQGWNDGNEYTCDLPDDHDGKHVDKWEGWEW